MEVLNIIVFAMFGFHCFIRQYWSCMLSCTLDELLLTYSISYCATTYTYPWFIWTHPPHLTHLTPPTLITNSSHTEHNKLLPLSYLHCYPCLPVQATYVQSSDRTHQSLHPPSPPPPPSYHEDRQWESGTRTHKLVSHHLLREERRYLETFMTRCLRTWIYM